MKYSTIRLYVFAALMVGSWWYLAFGQSRSCNPNSTPILAPKSSKPAYFSYLSSMKREDIQAALAGDEERIMSLMTEWDVDAQILIAHEVKGVKRLSHHDYLRAQILKRQLRMGAANSNFENVSDDLGVEFSKDQTYQRFLPQTFVAASFLLALTKPNQIVALPSGLRKNKHLFPEQLTAQIPLDIDQYNSETIFISRPDVAFVAQYSNPATLQTLREQDVPLFTLKYVDTVSDITSALKRVGELANCGQKAELLALFIESALISIDNRLMAAQCKIATSSGLPRVMFLNYYANFSVPTTKVINGQLLLRLKNQFHLYEDNYKEYNELWSIPIDQENILAFNPDYLIIATPRGAPLEHQIINNSAFTKVSAVQNQRVSFVDDATQNSPTQFLVLAYYDIAAALQK